MSDFIDSAALYPLKFTPIYHERIWGGTQMTDVLKREIPHGKDPIGESWELVDRDGEESVLANGVLAGKTLHELIAHYGSKLLGHKAASAGRFPLLVKLIDAGERLSLQVHPDENACREIGGGAEPKTEMWYIVAARRDARILAGLQGRATRQQLVANLNSPSVEDFLQVYPSQPGDAYFITSGTLHAIGGGNLILEIQQNSDTTYRVSDWGRVGSDGKPRELHIEKGIKSINFMNRTSPRIVGVSGSAGHNRKFDVVNSCPFFAVNDLRLESVWNDDTGSGASFHLLSAINRPVRVARCSAPELAAELQPGESCLIPACFGSYTVTPLADGECTVVKTTL
ncbi:MAG: class I mannose-6-phosphate isomerase [Victivallaceae bacterium]|nr:class I mannose-6-phosphate isomerase [Victivallaceae bacterium]